MNKNKRQSIPHCYYWSERQFLLLCRVYKLIFAEFTKEWIRRFMYKHTKFTIGFLFQNKFMESNTGYENEVEIVKYTICRYAFAVWSESQVVDCTTVCDGWDAFASSIPSTRPYSLLYSVKIDLSVC
jgi:hypothetical protein